MPGEHQGAAPFAPLFRDLRQFLRLSPEEHKELRTRLYAILDEFQGRPPTPGGRPYSVFVSIHEDVTRDPPG